MKNLKQTPLIIPFRNGRVSVGGKKFTVESGNKGRILLSEFLVMDKDLNAKISSNKVLNGIREHILGQMLITNNAKGEREISSITNWFGGSAYALDQTEEGFFNIVLRDTSREGRSNEKPYACPSDNIGGVLVWSLDSITKEGLKLLTEDGYIIDDNGEPIKPPETINEPEPPKVDPVKAAEVTSKVNNIVNERLSGRTRRVSVPV